MLIKFTLENYRSVKDSMELSLAAMNYYKEQQEQLIHENLPGLSGMKFLRAAAVFGPNASGKTTIFRALKTMRNMVMRSASMAADKLLPYTPYMLDEGSKGKPTRFFVAFTQEAVRYEYSFAYTSHMITEEKLSAFPRGREQVWFSREQNESKKESNLEGEPSTIIKKSGSLKIPAALHPLLNDNALLLSLLANYPKFEESTKVRSVIDWFAHELMMIDRGPKAGSDYPFSGEIISGESGTDFQRSFIQNMLQKADVGISQARIESVPLPNEFKDPEFLKILDGHELPDELKVVVFDHSSKTGSIKFSIEDESDGTYQLFTLSGHLAQAIEMGATLFIDEIDASLHPLLVREIVRCFLDPQSNPRNAQLVFTAHNPCLLDEDLLRRDQIWFTEKSDGATELYPLSEFSPRKDESLASGYLLGRYSATPLVPACFGRCHSEGEGGAYGE